MHHHLNFPFFAVEEIRKAERLSVFADIPADAETKFRASVSAAKAPLAYSGKLDRRAERQRARTPISGRPVFGSGMVDRKTLSGSKCRFALMSRSALAPKLCPARSTSLRGNRFG